MHIPILRVAAISSELDEDRALLQVKYGYISPEYKIQWIDRQTWWARYDDFMESLNT